MEYNFSQRYFHLYFIPLFPLKKTVTVNCTGCFAEYGQKQFYRDIEVKLNRVKERYPLRTPAWAFSGIFILIAFFTWAFWQSGRHDTVEADFIRQPKKGDVYWLEFSLGQYQSAYTTLRVDKVNKNEIFFTRNDTFVTKYTKVFGILGERYYGKREGVYSLEKIQDLYKKDSIISVTRD